MLRSQPLFLIFSGGPVLLNAMTTSSNSFGKWARALMCALSVDAALTSVRLSKPCAEAEPARLHDCQQ